MAVGFGQEEVIKYLIEELNVDTNCIDDAIWFWQIVEWKRYDIMDYLVIGNNQYELWCFVQAVKQHILEIIKYVVNNGANITDIIV